MRGILIPNEIVKQNFKCYDKLDFPKKQLSQGSHHNLTMKLGWVYVRKKSHL